MKPVYPKTPDSFSRISVINLPRFFPRFQKNLRTMLLDQSLNHRAGYGIHIHRLELSGKPHVAQFIGLDDDIADGAFHRQGEQVVNYFSVRCHGMRKKALRNL